MLAASYRSPAAAAAHPGQIPPSPQQQPSPARPATVLNTGGGVCASALPPPALVQQQQQEEDEQEQRQEQQHQYQHTVAQPPPPQRQSVAMSLVPAVVVTADAGQTPRDEWYQCVISRDANRSFGVDLVHNCTGDVQVAAVKGDNAQSAGVRQGSFVCSIAGTPIDGGGTRKVREILADQAVSSQVQVAFMLRHPASEASPVVMSTPLAAAPAAVASVAMVPVQTTAAKRKRSYVKKSTTSKRWAGKAESWGAKEIMAFFELLESHGRNFTLIARDLEKQGIPRNERQTRNFYGRLAAKCVRARGACQSSLPVCLLLLVPC